MTGKRKIGIGEVDEAPWGTHFCNFYKTDEELINVVVPFLKTGLLNNEFCVWITSGYFNNENAKELLRTNILNFDMYLHKGQIELISFDKWYFVEGILDKNRILKAWVDKVELALKMGYDGLRASGSADWLKEEHISEFLDYEKLVQETLPNSKVLALCNYSLSNCDTLTMRDVMLEHDFCVLNKEARQRVVANSDKSRVVKTLKGKVEELEELNKLFLGREKRVMELKNEIAMLNSKLKKNP